jgi:hypothetical protein
MSSSSQYPSLLSTALLRVKQAAKLAAERGVDSLGLAALSATGSKREDFLAAQFDLNRRLAEFHQGFGTSLDRSVAEARHVEHSPSTLGKLNWQSLSLVDDQQVEDQVMADRFSLAIQHESEWELRELDAYMGSLLRLPNPDHARNPLRPESVGKALIAGIDAVSTRPELRKVLSAELGRTLTQMMRTAYADIVADLRSAGVQPLSLALRTNPNGARTAFGNSGYDSAPAQARHGMPAATGFEDAGDTAAAALGQVSTRGGALYTRPAESGSGAGPSTGGGFHTTGGSRRAATIGQVDEQMMSLIRRLAFTGILPDTGMTPVEFGSRPSSLGGVPSRPTPLPNLIVAHREELRQASSGALDHMVIDVVGSLFDQILSDPKVPPQMARQIARLQLPVLRVALGDNTFFSSRRHPVRQFVNRIASLACAFDDLAEGAGRQFLDKVKALVQEIVSGDFDQMGVYEGKLDDLERFIAEQVREEVAEQGNTAELLAQKEAELLQQQRYMQQLRAELAGVDMQEFLREFLSQVWSQVLVLAQRKDAGGALHARFRAAARELVLSVLPKGTPADRQGFLRVLPQLMKDLNEGMALVGWSEDAKKAFFAHLLPAHAESLKGRTPSVLDRNLLVKQIDGILGAPLPQPGAVPPAGLLPVLDQVVTDVAFSTAEAQQVGFVAESAVDWDGSVDIDLSAEPEITEVDINIDGLPPPEPVEPTRGASLADNVQLGFAYQMHLEGQWQKVRLSYMSPGRAFYVFTRGKKHQKTISLTHRMLVRLCDSGRMRAFENAYLIERATARARRQLAEIGSATARH